MAKNSSIKVGDTLVKPGERATVRLPVADLYTVDAELLPPGAESVAGRPAIAAFWKGAIDAGVKDIVLTTVQLESAGDLAYEVGKVRLVASDGQASEDRYLVVWKRVNGKWQLHRDIWNSTN